jgi:hypothetical protein
MSGNGKLAVVAAFLPGLSFFARRPPRLRIDRHGAKGQEAK